MPWSDHHRRAARYNRWMNESLYNTCRTLTDEQLNSDRGLFFSSVSGTLNHLLITDLLWLGRLANSYPILEELHQIEFPPKLDGHISDDIQQLTPLREKVDDVIIRWCDLLRQGDATAMLEYTSTAGVEYAKSLDQVLQHLFNHQTHHRGQITAALSMMKIDFGATDLLFAPLEN